jgi:predicted GH43/DUF377 family glycosyl hydrolase
MLFFLSLLFFGSVCAGGIVTATKQIDLAEFPGAHNPSLLKVEKGFLLTFRYCPDVYRTPFVSYIGLVPLSDDLEPTDKPILLSTRHEESQVPSQSEDARLFAYRGKLFVIYNDIVDRPAERVSDRRDMFMAELVTDDEGYALSRPTKLVYGEKYYLRSVQKNWCPFEWNKKLFITYFIDPHEVIYPNLINGNAYSCYESFGQINWKYGELRGGTPAQLVDGKYLAFFHSAYWTASDSSAGMEMWHYFMGAYLFDAAPPFPITHASPAPIKHESFYTFSPFNKRVVFPGGFAVVGDSIYLAYGKDDSEVWIATLNKKALMESLIPTK